MFVAKTTVTKFCSLDCARKNYKKRAKEFKKQTVLSEVATTFVTNTITQENIKNKDFLSIKETSILIGASRWTIQRMIQLGLLKSAKFGNRTIILRSEINNLFK